MIFQIKQADLNNEFLHNYASKKYEIIFLEYIMKYTSQKYIQKKFTTHSRNDFDFWNESGEILLKINENTRNLGF